MTGSQSTLDRGNDIYKYSTGMEEIFEKVYEELDGENRIEVDSSKNVHLDLDGVSEIVSDIVNTNTEGLFGYILDSREDTVKTSVCVVDSFDDSFSKLGLDEIGTDNEGDIVRIEGQVQDIGKPTINNLSGVWECQNDHRTETTYARWTDSMETPNVCRGDEDCLDRPTNRVKNWGVKIDVQQVVLSEQNKDDRNSRSLIGEVDQPYLNDLDRRENVEILGRVLIADRGNEANVEPYLHILGYRFLGHTIDLNDSKIQQLEDIAEESGNIIQDLTDSVAPRIIDKDGQYEAKKAILCSIVRASSHTDREMIHTLLYGQKGSGKSRILEFAEKITDNSQFADVQNSTGPGLTATAKQTSKLAGEGDQWIITGGTIPQAHNSVAFLDELDKSEERDQELLGMPMSSGRVIVKKAGEAELRAETSVCASANPEEHSYHGEEPIDSLSLPDHIIDRFDLMIRVDDIIADREKEREVLMKQSKRDKGDFEVPFDVQTLKEYIAYAKQKDVVLSEKANEKIVDYILDLRMDCKQSSINSLDISAREQQKLTRISEAMAKLRLSDRVDVLDVKRAWKLMLYGYQSMTFDKLNLNSPEIISGGKNE